MKKWFLPIAALGLTLGLAACSDTENDSTTETNGVEDSEPTVDNEETTADPTESGEDAEAMVSAELIDTGGTIVGAAVLTEEDDGVRVKINANDLSEGQHGFHFHEVGKCELPDFESAGGHFNPTDASHGLDHDEGPHAGDLPNLEVGEDGLVDEEIIAENVTLKSGEENSLLQEGGTALVIHAEADDEFPTFWRFRRTDYMWCDSISFSRSMHDNIIL